MTLDLSKGRFFTKVFLALCIHKTKVRNVQFHHFILEIEVRNDPSIVVEYGPGLFPQKSYSTHILHKRVKGFKKVYFLVAFHEYFLCGHWIGLGQRGN